MMELLAVFLRVRFSAIHRLHRHLLVPTASDYHHRGRSFNSLNLL